MCETELLTFGANAVCVAEDAVLVIGVIMALKTALNSHTVPRLSVQLSKHHHIVLRLQDFSRLQGQPEVMSLSSAIYTVILH